MMVWLSRRRLVEPHRPLHNVGGNAAKRDLNGFTVTPELFGDAVFAPARCQQTRPENMASFHDVAVAPGAVNVLYRYAKDGSDASGQVVLLADAFDTQPLGGESPRDTQSDNRRDRFLLRRARWVRQT